jgi:hypothetical protein
MTEERTSAARRQRTCAACGASLTPDARTDVEVLLDGEVRYVAVHPGHSTYAPARERAAARRFGDVLSEPGQGREVA